MRRIPTALPLVAVALLGLAPSSAAAQRLGLESCPSLPGFACGTLRVPLDRTGQLEGTIALRVVAERRSRRDRGILIALSGGPGQSAAASAPSFQAVLRPLLAKRRLVVIDQRGTGASGALRCPAVQKARSLDPVDPSVVAGCAQLFGVARERYATADTVADLDALREAFGAAKTDLMGISYGTFVAQQYARTHPGRVGRLVLDSVVSGDGVDPFLLDSYRRIGRIVAEGCRRGRCRRATTDPAGDLAAVAGALAAGPLRGRTFDARGRPRRTVVRDGGELFLMLVAGDLNPYLQPALPGALAAARAGDLAPLLRLRRVAAGGPNALRDFSVGLNVTTLCNDTALPYALTTPVEERPALVAAALDAVPPRDYAPFDRAAVLINSIADDCQLWPQGDEPQTPSREPLPDVPTLILNGRLDLRTPLENAEALAREIPSAQTVFVPGTGHDTVDVDLTGCVEAALRRFEAGRRVGRPCSGRSNQVDPFPRPPRSLNGVARATGVPGARGRVVSAAIDTIVDAQITATQSVFAGLEPLRGGGLRSGRWTAGQGAGRVTLHRYAYVPEVRVSGTIRSHERGASGRLRIDGPGSLDGRLTLDSRGRLRGRIGGRAVHARDRLLASASAAQGAIRPRSRQASANAARHP